MKNLILVLAFLFTLPAFAGNGSGNVSSVIGYGGTSSAPAMVVPSSSTNEYAVTCGHGTSDITDGNYYRCFKQDSNGAASNWALASGKVAYCRGFNSTSNVTTTIGVIFGAGTAAVTHNNSSAPAGDVKFMGNGAYMWVPQNGVPFWHAIPLIFRAVGDIYYPYAQLFGSSAKIAVTLICVEP